MLRLAVVDYNKNMLFIIKFDQLLQKFFTAAENSVINLLIIQTTQHDTYFCIKILRVAKYTY